LADIEKKRQYEEEQYRIAIQLSLEEQRIRDEQQKMEMEIKYKNDVEYRVRQEMHFAEERIRREVEEKLRLETETRLKSLEESLIKTELQKVEDSERLWKQQEEIWMQEELQRKQQYEEEIEVHKIEKEMLKEELIRQATLQKEKMDEWMKSNPQWKSFYVDLGFQEYELNDPQTLQQLIDKTVQFVMASDSTKAELKRQFGVAPGSDNSEYSKLSQQLDDSLHIPEAPPVPKSGPIINTENTQTMAEQLKQFKFNLQPVQKSPRDFSVNQQKDLQDILTDVMRRIRVRVEPVDHNSESSHVWE